jgi:hypothetical protein
MTDKGTISVEMESLSTKEDNIHGYSLPLA